jgi:hypothetical protein
METTTAVTEPGNAANQLTFEQVYILISLDNNSCPQAIDLLTPTISSSSITYSTTELISSLPSLQLSPILDSITIMTRIVIPASTAMMVAGETEVLPASGDIDTPAGPEADPAAAKTPLAGAAPPPAADEADPAALATPPPAGCPVLAVGEATTVTITETASASVVASTTATTTDAATASDAVASAAPVLEAGVATGANASMVGMVAIKTPALAEMSASATATTAEVTSVPKAKVTPAPDMMLAPVEANATILDAGADTVAAPAVLVAEGGKVANIAAHGPPTTGTAGDEAGVDVAGSEEGQSQGQGGAGPEGGVRELLTATGGRGGRGDGLSGGHGAGGRAAGGVGDNGIGRGNGGQDGRSAHH